MPNRVKLSKLAAEVVRLSGGVMGQNIGFAVLVFEFGRPGNIGYASNAKREDMLRAMEEFVRTESLANDTARVCASCDRNPVRYIMTRCDLCEECHEALRRAGVRVKVRKVAGQAGEVGKS